MGNTIILTKNPPSDLATIEKTEAYQISLLGSATGPQTLQEQHGWWNEKEQKAEWLATTLKLEDALSEEEAKRAYYDQLWRRVDQGFVHSRSYNFNEEHFVYRDLSQGNSAAAGS